MTYRNGTAIEYKGYTLTKNRFGWRITREDDNKYFGYGGTLKEAKAAVERNCLAWNEW